MLHHKYFGIKKNQQEQVYLSQYSIITDGVDECITFGNIQNETSHDPFSVSFWYKSAPSGADKRFILDKLSYGSTGFGWWVDCQYHLPRFYIGAGYGGDGIEVKAPAIQYDIWYQITFTYDGSRNGNGVKCYINGTEVTTSITQDNLVTQDCSHNSELCIGRYYWGTDQHFVAGIVGDLWKVPVVMTPQQVAEYYNNGKELDARNHSLWNSTKSHVRSLYINWEADDLTGGTGLVTDLTDNHYVGTPVNTEAADKIGDVP